ncbi:MAG: PIN domain-containing protein [Limisphaerales bacterium]
MYLLDTNVFSELFKSGPDANVLRFLHESEWLLPVPVIAEIQAGAENVKSPARRLELNNKIDATIEIYGDFLLDWNAETSRVWGRLQFSDVARRQPQALWDSLIDAMAVQGRLIVATRNEKDFRHAKTFNPFAS